MIKYYKNSIGTPNSSVQSRYNGASHRNARFPLVKDTAQRDRQQVLDSGLVSLGDIEWWCIYMSAVYNKRVSGGTAAGGSEVNQVVR